MQIGVLAMQGAFREHAAALRRCGATPVEIRMPQDLERVAAVIIPGGESTTIGKLLVDNGLMEPLRARAEEGMPVFGTCAGAILLARQVDSSWPRLKLMDLRVKRNAYGRQVDSFEVEVAIPALGEKPFPAVFIRAPRIEAAGAGVEVLARYRDGIVLARQGNLLAATFHPELTGDLRLHRYFLKMIERRIPCGTRS